MTLPLLVIACSAPGSGAGEAVGGGRAGRSAGRGGGSGPVPVVTARVVQKAVPVALAVIGSAEAISSVQIRAQVTGQLSAVRFAEGQEVVAGQPLFSLDSRPLAAALRQAEAVLARDTATLQNLQAQQTRAETLFNRGLIPRDQFDSQRSSSASLTATVAADAAAVESARLNVQYADIRSPISGRTGALAAHLGDLVRANDTIPLVIINQLSPIYVTFSVPGRYLTDIRRYQAQKPLSVVARETAEPASSAAPSGTIGAAPAPSTPGGRSAVARPDGQTPIVTGVLSFIDNTVDSTTGTIRLKGTFPNADRRLWPGAFVQVTLQLTVDADALVVPATAVQASQDGTFVYVVKADRTVELRVIKVERQLDDQIVVAEGVAAGEVVVTDGQLRLTSGATVSERDEAGGPGAAGGRAGAKPAADSGGPAGAKPAPDKVGRAGAR
ncbi:MAG: efflux RND transporter periplasmic adaptor subunit [Acidobacteriota bacterium]